MWCIDFTGVLITLSGAILWSADSTFGLIKCIGQWIKLDIPDLKKKKRSLYYRIRYVEYGHAECVLYKY